MALIVGAYMTLAIIMIIQDNPEQIPKDNPEKGQETAEFHLKSDHSMAPRHGRCLIEHFDSPIAVDEEWPSLEMPA